MRKHFTLLGFVLFLEGHKSLALLKTRTIEIINSLFDIKPGKHHSTCLELT